MNNSLEEWIFLLGLCVSTKRRLRHHWCLLLSVCILISNVYLNWSFLSFLTPWISRFCDLLCHSASLLQCMTDFNSALAGRLHLYISVILELDFPCSPPLLPLHVPSSPQNCPQISLSFSYFPHFSFPTSPDSHAGKWRDESFLVYNLLRTISFSMRGAG